MKQKQNCREYAQPGQLYTRHVLCVYQVCSLRPKQADLSRDANTWVLSQFPNLPLWERLLQGCALTAGLTSLSELLYVTSPKQFNIFLMSTWVLIRSREAKFLPDMFCNQKHICTAEHLLSDLLHGYSLRPWFRQQLFSLDISPEYDWIKQTWR